MRGKHHNTNKNKKSGGIYRIKSLMLFSQAGNAFFNVSLSTHTPVLPVKATIMDGLGQVLRPDIRMALQVGNGP